MNLSDTGFVRRSSRPMRRAFFILATTMLCVSSSAARGGTLVEMGFGSFGSVYVDLLDSVAPISAANFLQYVNAGRYSATMIHRSVDPNSVFGVVQGGGFDPQGVSVPQFAPIVLEYHLANARRTLGAARTSFPDSATSQWYFNTTDNSTLFGPSNGGGFAVFGWVVGPGMTTIDAINALPTFAFQSPFSQLPLDNYTQADFDALVDPVPHAVVLEDVTVITTHPSFQNPIDRFDVNNDGLATPLDLSIIEDHLFTFGSHVMDASYVGEDYLYLDTNGDGQISELDLVPEPSSAALAVLGIVAVLAARWRKRR